MLLTGDRPGELVPGAYKGREQTLIKHKVVNHFVQGWSQKLASIARFQGGVAKLNYVDCFSGPWKSVHQGREDTSICIGLDALQEAAGFWKGKGLSIQLAATFVEKNPESFKQLKEYLDSRRDNHRVEIHALPGTFQEHVPEIERILADDPAFLFVDPTGWEGAAMKYIAPLASKPRRDVMINVMYGDINRFRDSKLPFIPEQLADFFGKPLPPGLDEEGVMRFYRERLKEMCGFKYTADMIVEDPCIDRTKFRLAFGAHRFEGIELFRDGEGKILGREAPKIRAEAKEDARLARTDQLALLAPQASQSHCYSELNKAGLAWVEAFLSSLGQDESISYEALKIQALQECHITESNLKEVLWKWKLEERLPVLHFRRVERSIKEGHHLGRLKPAKPPEPVHEQFRLF